MIVQHGAVVKYSGMLPCRVVLRALKDGNTRKVVEYVVHTQGFTETGSSFSNGNYFPVHCYGSEEAALAEAKARFGQRQAEFEAEARPENLQHPEVIDVIMRLVIDSQMARVA